jgi:prevent-host-death family protein
MVNKDNIPSHWPKVWQFQEAKAKLSHVMDEVQESGMQMIVRNRDEIYVILSKERYEEFTQPKGSLIDFFLSAPYPEVDLGIKRNQDLPREIDL